MPPHPFIQTMTIDVPTEPKNGNVIIEKLRVIELKINELTVLSQSLKDEQSRSAITAAQSHAVLDTRISIIEQKYNLTEKEINELQSVLKCMDLGVENYNKELTRLGQSYKILTGILIAIGVPLLLSIAGTIINYFFNLVVR